MNESGKAASISAEAVPLRPWERRAAKAIQILQRSSRAIGPILTERGAPTKTLLELDLARIDTELNHSVYFLYCANRIKIGYTRGDVDERISKIEGTIPLHIWIVKVIPGGRITEFKIHHRFAACKIEGWREWFSLSDELRSYINEGPADRARFAGAERSYREWLKTEMEAANA